MDDRGDRSVDVYVRKLRQKLEKASPNWEYIHTHFGVGYPFEAYSEAAEAEAPERPDQRVEETRSRRQTGLVARQLAR